MSSIYSRRFWALAGERAAKSAAHAMALALAGSNTGPVNLFALDAQIVFGAALTGAFLSVLTSVMSIPAGPGDSPSLL